MEERESVSFEITEELGRELVGLAFQMIGQEVTSIDMAVGGIVKDEYLAEGADDNRVRFRLQLNIVDIAVGDEDFTEDVPAPSVNSVQ